MGYFYDILQCLAAILTVVLGILTSLSKLKNEDGTWRNSGKILVFFLILGGIITIVTNIWSSVDKRFEDLKIEKRYLTDSLNNQKEYESLIQQTQKALVKSDSMLFIAKTSIDKLDGVLNLSYNITSELRQQLTLHRSINIKTRDILSENKIIIAKAQEAVDNSDRSANPLMPFHFYISYSINFEDTINLQSWNSLQKLKKEIENGSINSSANISVSKKDGKITAMYIKDYGTIPNLLIDPPLIGFILYKKEGNIQTKEFNIDYSCNPFTNKKNNNDKRFYHLDIDYLSKKITFSNYYTNNSTYSKYDILLGVKDLVDAHFSIGLTFKYFRIQSVQFFTGNNFSKAIALDFGDETPILKDNITIYDHKITQWELTNFSTAHYYQLKNRTSEIVEDY
jgi:hypothetical protein